MAVANALIIGFAEVGGASSDAHAGLKPSGDYEEGGEYLRERGANFLG